MELVTSSISKIGNHTKKRFVLCQSLSRMRYFMFTSRQSTNTMKYGKKALSCIVIAIPTGPPQQPRSTNIKMSISLSLSGTMRVFFNVYPTTWSSKRIQSKWRHGSSRGLDDITWCSMQREDEVLHKRPLLLYCGIKMIVDYSHF